MRKRGGYIYSDFRLSNGERVRKSLGTSSVSEAKALQKALIVQMEAELREKKGKEALKAKFPLKEVFKRALHDHEPWRASRSRITIEGNFEFIKKHFGEERCLSTITKAECRDYAKTLGEAGKSNSTINQRLSLISILLKCAEEWSDGVIEAFKMPRRKPPKGRIRTLSVQEEEKVLRWFRASSKPRASDMVALVAFLLDTGFRLSEALNLNTRDIHWDSRMVPAWETKGGDPRFVPMTRRVARILKERSGLSMPFGMFSKDSAEDYWSDMRDSLGINIQEDPEFVLHALRHTCASRLAAAGNDAFRIQKWMGHKSITTTQIYVTLFAPDLRSLSKTLERSQYKYLEEPEGASKVVPKIVPKSASKSHSRGLPAGRVRCYTSRPRLGGTDEGSVGKGLLIRRSLVRAQVGEPASIRVSEEKPDAIIEGVPKIVPKSKG